MQRLQTLHSASLCFIALTKIFTRSKMGQSVEDEFLVERTLDNCTKNSIRSHIKKALGACYLGQRSPAHITRECQELIAHPLSRQLHFAPKFRHWASYKSPLCYIYTGMLLLWKKLFEEPPPLLPLGRLISWLATSRARPLGASAPAPVLKRNFCGPKLPDWGCYICIRAQMMNSCRCDCCQIFSNGISLMGARQCQSQCGRHLWWKMTRHDEGKSMRGSCSI